jgi:hypothetical protein
MSAIAHLPGYTQAATHRLITLFVAVALVLAAVTVTVVLLLNRDTAVGSPSLPRIDTGVSDTCFGAPVGSAC